MAVSVAGAWALSDDGRVVNQKIRPPTTASTPTAAPVTRTGFTSR
ncbi:hypothetical protein ABGB19_08610 [Mycobacterium sp. B14F4]